MRILMPLLMAAMTLLLTACGSEKQATAEPPSAPITQEMEPRRVLVVYFSRADENAAVGYIEKGNTQILAEMIAERRCADLFEIKTQQPYPKEYQAATEVAKKEKEANARPALAGDLPKMREYDILFLGYPIWWGDMPMPVYTFLESEKFTGMDILPFCTHEGSGISGTDRTIADITKGKVHAGFELEGHIAQNAPEEARAALYQWIEKEGI